MKILEERKMADYIKYCQEREDDACTCPTCGEWAEGLRLYPYFYDEENNDVYFAARCPHCGELIISKE